MKKYVAEFIGTAVLVIFGCGSRCLLSIPCRKRNGVKELR